MTCQKGFQLFSHIEKFYIGGTYIHNFIDVHEEFFHQIN